MMDLLDGWNYCMFFVMLSWKTVCFSIELHELAIPKVKNILRYSAFPKHPTTQSHSICYTAFSKSKKKKYESIKIVKFRIRNSITNTYYCRNKTIASLYGSFLYPCAQLGKTSLIINPLTYMMKRCSFLWSSLSATTMLSQSVPQKEPVDRVMFRCKAGLGMSFCIG